MSFNFNQSSNSPKGYHQVSTMNPLQQRLMELLGGGLGQGGQESVQYLRNLLSGSPESMSAFEKPLMRQFNEEIIPGLSEKFAGLGAGGLSSSYFQKALGQAGSGLQERLGALRGGLQLGASNSLLGNLQGLLGQQTQAFLPKTPGFLQQLLGGVAGGAGQGLSMLPFMFL